jgi:DNA polymerase-3 subunit gamma/tau
LNSFNDLIELFLNKKELLLHHYLTEEIHLVSYQFGKLEFRPTTSTPKDLANKIYQNLQEWTNHKWIVIVSDDIGNPTIKQQQEQLENIHKQKAANLPIVKAVLESFPGSSIINVHENNINKIVKEHSHG